MDTADIFSEDCGTKSKWRVVGSPDNLFLSLESRYSSYGPKDFIPINSHVILYISEDCWLDEKAFTFIRISKNLTAGGQRGTFRNSKLNVSKDSVSLNPVYLGPLGGILAKRVPDFGAVDLLQEMCHEVIIHLFVNEYPTVSCTNLPSI